MKNAFLPQICLLQPLRWGLSCGLVGFALVGCRGAAPPMANPPPLPEAPSAEVPAPSMPNTMAPNAVAPNAVASIRNIAAQPVWVRPAQGEETAAELGMTLQYEDTIRTEAPALVEVGLGEIVFRLGGNASLTLRPNQTLQFAAGQMLTWVEGKPSGPVTIQTPVGIAGIRGTTVFVNVDENPQAPVEIFAWEGEVIFQPTRATDGVVIRDGEQLLVSPGEVDVAALQRRVRRFEAAEFRQRLENSPLINDFDQPLPTLSQIESVGETLETGR